MIPLTALRSRIGYSAYKGRSVFYRKERYHWPSAITLVCGMGLIQVPRTSLVIFSHFVYAPLYPSYNQSLIVDRLVTDERPRPRNQELGLEVHAIPKVSDDQRASC